jgi:hypothetical protein
MALERFIPKSPDIFIRNSQDFEVAKFGHLNTIVEYINNNSAKPAGLNGYVQFNNNSALGGDAGLFWDNVNKRLGIGTVIPATTFQVNGVQALTNADLTGYNLYSIFNIVRNGATSIALDRFTGAPHFNFRAAGGTIASPSTQVGELGNIGWWSHSGTGFNRNVLLLAEASNFVGGLAQTQRLSISMGESGPSSNSYFSMVNGNTFFGSGASSVTPTARVQIKGSGSTSATTSLLVQNSAGNNSFEVKDDRSAIFSAGLTTSGILSFANIDIQAGLKVLTTVGIGGYNAAKDGTTVDIYGSQTTASSFGGAQSLWINNTLLANNNNYNLIGLRINPTFDHSTFVNTVDYGIQFNSTFAFSTGTNNATNFILNPTYNYTGGTNTVRGIYYNPTLTSLTNTTHIALQTVTGDVIFGSTSGNVGIGTTAPIAPLNVYNSNASLSNLLLLEQDTSAILGQIINYRKNGSVNLTSGTELGRLSFGGYFNSTYSPPSQVCSGINGYYGGSGTDRVGGLRLITWNGGGATTRLQVSPDGKIGIGTTAPSAKLSILGDGSTSATTSLLVQNSAGTTTFTVNDAGNALMSSGSTLAIGAISIFDDTAGPRSISTGGQGLIVGGNNSKATFANNGSITINGTGNILFRPVYNAGGIILSSTSNAGPSDNILTFMNHRNDGVKSAVINTTDFSASGNTPINLFIYAGKETALNNQGNLILQHDGTSTRGVVGIGTSTPNASAKVEISSTTQGFLPPRMTTAQRLAIASPANGLIVFDTDVQNLCYRRDGVWVQATFAAV